MPPLRPVGRGCIHVKTHQRIAELVYDALPRAAQDFLRLSDVELHWYARVPDEVAADNVAVFGGCAIEEAWAHSLKMEWDRSTDTFSTFKGSVATTMAQVPRLARNAVREGRFDEAREHLATAIHYATDSTTIWHLTHELSADEHRNGEAELVKQLKLLSHPGPLALPAPKSLYESTISVAEDTVRQQLDRVRAAQEGDGLAKDKDLCAEMLQRCADWSLACVLYAWRFIEKA